MHNEMNSMHLPGSADLLRFSRFRTKSEAQSFATSRGWQRKDAKRFTTRFDAGWLVGRTYDENTFRVLAPEGWIDIEF